MSKTDKKVSKKGAPVASTNAAETQTNDLAALNAAESMEGITPTDSSIAEPKAGKAAKTATPKVPLDLKAQAGNLGEFVKNSFNDYAKVEAASELQATNTIIYEKDGDVKVAIIDSIEGDVINVKPNSLSKASEIEAIGFADFTEVFHVKSISKLSIKGDHTKEIWNLIKTSNASVDPTTRIGGVFVDAAAKTSENGKKFQANIVDYFKTKLGITVQLRFSNTAGKVQGRDAEGFAILAKNPDESISTELFRSGAHHYSKVKMFEIEPKGDTDFEIVAEGDDKLKAMIVEVAELSK